MKITFLNFFFFLVLTSLFIDTAISQEPYINELSEFRSAVNQDTRTRIGLPGKNYFVNKAKYNINVSFNAESGILSGEETVTYINNSNQQLSEIFFNLYRNIYKKGAVRQREVNADDVTDNGMEITYCAIKESGNFINCSKGISGTQCKVILPVENLLRSGDSICLNIKWNVKIAEKTKLRGGKYDDNSWFVPYWYPQIAVFDDVYGWDRINHSGNEEFYFEFADYNVTIKTDNNMCVWATGNLTNEKEIFNQKILSRINQARKSDKEISILSAGDYPRCFDKSDRVWKFKAENVADFVFVCSSAYNWRAKSFVVDKTTGRRVMTGIVYKSPEFEAVIKETADVLNYLSNERPKVPYPYPHMTIFEGSGGMEFPMIVNQRCESDYNNMMFVTSHEVTHTYFPFVTGINQNSFGFLDEGLTMFDVQTYQNARYIDGYNIIALSSKITENNSATRYDIPLIVPSYSITDMRAFTIASYYKPQYAYTVLENIVGKDVMDTIMHQFTVTWAGKHPMPNDFFYLAQDISGINLEDFWVKWFCMPGNPDLQIESVIKQNNAYKVKIKNVGNLPLPIKLTVNSDTVINRSAKEFLNNNTVEITLPSNLKVDYLELSDYKIPDTNRKDNKYPRE